MDKYPGRYSFTAYPHMSHDEFVQGFLPSLKQDLFRTMWTGFEIRDEIRDALYRALVTEEANGVTPP